MDFWDVAKVLVRRWFVSVPLLILTVAACGLVAVNTTPDYVATVHVAFVPGSSTRPSTTNGPNVFNPWEPEALAEAVVIPLKTKELADSMRASGYKGEWTAENGIGTLAVVVITVTSSTPADSVRTAQHLVDLVFEDVKQRQTPLRLTPGETIKANQIEPAPTVEKKSMKIIRSAVVIGAVGHGDAGRRCSARRTSNDNSAGGPGETAPSVPQHPPGDDSRWATSYGMTAQSPHRSTNIPERRQTDQHP